MELLDTWIKEVNKSINDINEHKGLKADSKRHRILDIGYCIVTPRFISHSAT